MFLSFFFFFNDTATTEIYTLSLHDALPILDDVLFIGALAPGAEHAFAHHLHSPQRCHGLGRPGRSEEHTSELQSHSDLVCRLLLEKKKKSAIQNSSLVAMLASDMMCAITHR